MKRHVPLPGNMAVIVVTEMGRMVGNYQTEKWRNSIQVSHTLGVKFSSVIEPDSR